MNHRCKVLLNTKYDNHPATIEVIVNKKSIYNEILKNNITLEFDWTEEDFFKIEIKKTGKTLDIVKNLERQEVTVEEVLLNGFSLHPDKFGIFFIKNNPYVKDAQIQSNHLALNGTWTLDVPLFTLKGIPTLTSNKEFRDKVTNSSIACFGCSFTFGSFLEYNESWPAQLSINTRKDVKNYGIGGSNNQEIIANACEYAKKYQTNDVIILLCHFCSLQLIKDNQLHNWQPLISRKLQKLIKDNQLCNWQPDSDNKFYKLFPKELKKMIDYSETSLLFAGQVPYFLEKIEEIKSNIKGNVFVSTYIEDHYECLKKIDNKNFILLPFYEMSKEFPLASDNFHPGPEHNRLFAESILEYIK